MLRQEQWEPAANVLERATQSGQVETAVLHVVHRGQSFSRHFGKADSENAMFLLGSISKPINMAALMTLWDRGMFKLDDPVKKYLPRFTGEGRELVTIRHLLTHVSGLPDQLKNNNELRRSHAPLPEFVEHAIATPVEFQPGTKYQYSSMGILLAAHIAELLSGVEIRKFVEQAIFQPLMMEHSAQGLGKFKLEQMVTCQAEGAAPESGSGDPEAEKWNWNSRYWRSLGAPWGGTHASAGDVAKFLLEFMEAKGEAIKPKTARLMIQNQNPEGFPPRGLGFAVGESLGTNGCSTETFGHTGSTGTICWADPQRQTVCVVLTSLPSRALNHPRQRTAELVAAAAGPA